MPSTRVKLHSTLNFATPNETTGVESCRLVGKKPLYIESFAPQDDSQGGVVSLDFFAPNETTASRWELSQNLTPNETTGDTCRLVERLI